MRALSLVLFAAAASAAPLELTLDYPPFAASKPDSNWEHWCAQALPKVRLILDGKVVFDEPMRCHGHPKSHLYFGMVTVDAGDQASLEVIVESLSLHTKLQLDLSRGRYVSLSYAKKAVVVNQSKQRPGYK